MGLTSCILRNYPVIEQTGDLFAIHHSNSLKKIILDIFKLNIRNGKNKLFLPTSHLFASLVARNVVQKQVLNPTRDTEDTKESHHCYQWTCHHMYVCGRNMTFGSIPRLQSTKQLTIYSALWLRSVDHIRVPH